MFERVDVGVDGNRKLSLEEIKQAVPLLEKWGVQVTDPEQTFRTTDTDTDNTGNSLRRVLHLGRIP